MKALFNGKFMEVEPQIDFDVDNDGVAVVRDKEGVKIGEVNVYGWDIEEPYVLTPLYFAELPELSVVQRFRLIKQFEEWYGATEQMPSCWALEFELITRMLCCDTAALIINPKYLKLDEEMYQVITDIIYPVLFEKIEDALEKDFFEKTLFLQFLIEENRIADVMESIKRIEEIEARLQEFRKLENEPGHTFAEKIYYHEEICVCLEDLDDEWQNITPHQEDFLEKNPDANIELDGEIEVVKAWWNQKEQTKQNMEMEQK